MTVRSVEIDDDALDAARTVPGTSTIADTLHAALRLVVTDRERRVDASSTP